MHESGAFVAGPQTLEAVQPRLDLFGHVPVDAQAAAMGLPAAGNLGQDATGAQFLTQFLGCRKRGRRTRCSGRWRGLTRLAAHRWDRIDQWQGLSDVVSIGPGEHVTASGRAFRIGGDVVFAAFFASVRGVLARFIAAIERPYALEESMAARLQSILSA